MIKNKFLAIVEGPKVLFSLKPTNQVQTKDNLGTQSINFKDFFPSFKILLVLSDHT